MGDTTQRDAVLERFMSDDAGWYSIKDLYAMADRIVELEATVERQDRILDALREPSEDIQALAFWEFDAHNSMKSALKAAVAAAEQEVGRE